MGISKLKQVDIIATVGPRSLSRSVIHDMIKAGASILRINGSHEDVGNIEICTKQLREWAGKRAKILVDIPGNKIRTSHLGDPIILKPGKVVQLFKHQVNFPGFFKLLRKGDTILANDGLIRFKVLKQSSEGIVFKSETEGKLENNKGFHISRKLPLPFLFQKDVQILQLARRIGIDFVGLSFVRSPSEVREAKKYIQGSAVKLLVKIETQEAVNSLNKILAESDQILIDRGDLAAEIGYANVSRIQAKVVKAAKDKKVKVALATQFLHSMVDRDVPLIAEVDSLYHAIQSGVDAIQVSEETSIGQFPERVIQVLTTMIGQGKRKI